MDKRGYNDFLGVDEMNQDLEQFGAWWLCENILCHHGQIALMRMDFPRVFILIRDYSEAYPCTFDEFRDKIAEVNFLDPSERDGADIESIIIDAWNFLALTEREEDRIAEEYYD